jgi:shikimate dehydrogenase
MSTAPSRSGAAVLGSPIGHSLSPALHRAAYTELGLLGWSYRAIECTERDLADTLRELEGEGLAGVSLTMPLKRAVMPLLSGLDDRSAVVGAANTVLFGDVPGEWSGANTDVPGMVAVLAATGTDFAAADSSSRPWLLGAGATAASALAALSELGCVSVGAVARRPDATDYLSAVARRLDVQLDVRPWSELAGALTAPLVISTAPAGATDEVAAQLGPVNGVLVDVVYSPWPTALAAAWTAGNGQAIGGLELLIEQALEQVWLMTGRLAPAEPVRHAGYAALESP